MNGGEKDGGKKGGALATNHETPRGSGNNDRANNTKPEPGCQVRPQHCGRTERALEIFERGQAAGLNLIACALPSKEHDLDGKEPLHRFKDYDPDLVRSRIIERRGRVNFGLLLGDYVMLDFDGPDAASAITGLESKLGPLPACYRQATSPGRKHLILRSPRPGFRLQVIDAFGAKLDVKTGPTLYAIIPPSVHKSGNRYRPTSDLMITETGTLPEVWLDVFERAGASRPTITGQKHIDRSTRLETGTLDDVHVGTGQRNATLFNIASRMRRKQRGGDFAKFAGALLLINEKICEPPLTDAEVGRIAASVFSFTPRRVREGSRT